MSKARKLQRARAWARYVNHYGHNVAVIIGGWGAVHAMNLPGKHWHYIRQQQKRPFCIPEGWDK